LRTKIAAINRKLDVSLGSQDFVTALVDYINEQPNKYKSYMESLWEKISTGKWAEAGAMEVSSSLAKVAEEKMHGH